MTDPPASYLFKMEFKATQILLIMLVSVDISLCNILNSCGSPALEKCICGEFLYENEHKYIVNCTNTGFDSTEMLTNLPEQTQVLIFQGNDIPDLPWNVFGDLKDLSKLTTIDMSNNGIKEIRGKSYHHVRNVERLILNHNSLSISNQGDAIYNHPRVFSNFLNLKELHLTNAFADNTDDALANDLHHIFVGSNLTKIFKLHLEQNEIKGFRDKSVFCDLPSLRDLYLGDNKIPSINFDVLCLKKLWFLDLEDNNITKFSQQDLNDFDRMTYPHRKQEFIVDIRGNPFQCDVAIKNLYKWMQLTNVTVRHKETLQCHHSKYGNKYIVNLTSLAESKHERLSKSVTVLVVILTIVLISLAATYIYLTKDGLKTKLSPLMEIVSRKVHYTTIEAQVDDV